MGLRFVQKNHCEPDAETARTIEAVQSGILAELSWDYRVEDAYLQKVWTLIESGRRDKVKAVWVQRILDAQQPDGGWTGADVIMPLPGAMAMFWQGGLHPRIGPRPQSNFHATAQGLYLMALLINGAVTVASLADSWNCGNMRPAMIKHDPIERTITTLSRCGGRMGVLLVAISLGSISACGSSSDPIQGQTHNAAVKHSLVWDAGSWDDTTWN
jgi:hypothetical protein